VTRGLYDEFGAKRVVGTPISETAIAGAALGAALALQAAGHLDRKHAETLLRPMAEGLPWLTPDGDV